MLNDVLSSIEGRKKDAIAGLSEFLTIPSVSTKPEHADDVRRCAQWLCDQLGQIGLSGKVLDTKGHPVVVARNEHRAGRPTVLIYGHYDVQPPEPLDQWKTPPFQPSVRDGAIYARGAVDDKGQVWAHVEAIRAWQQKGGGLPINVTFLVEGEEEIGSPNLEAFLKSYKAELKADLCVISDTNQFARGMPAITYGLRGIVSEEITVTAADHDLHSGIYGGAVPNPAIVLCQLLATLHDKDGRVNIPGFYDDVAPLTEQERANWRKLPFDEKAYRDELKLPGLFGEAGYSTIERSWARPTCDINGMGSGYQGHGAKTIIPSTAFAKITMRMVPKQNSLKVAEAFEKAMRERCPKTVTLQIHRHGASDGMLLPLDTKPVQHAAEAIEVGFGAKPVFMRAGGSIPIVTSFKTVLGLDTLLVGFGLPDDRVHSPNEKFDLEALRCGTRTCAVLYERLAKR